MGATVRCAGCGHMVPSDARTCLRCGRTMAAPMVELERLDVPAASGHSERVVVEHHGGERPKRSLLTAGAVVVVLIVVMAFVFAGGTDSGDGDVAEPAPSQPSTTVDDQAETTQSAPSQPTTTEIPGATVVMLAADSPGPVLGYDTGGLSLYLASGRGLARVELDTGRVTHMEHAFSSSSRFINSFQIVDGTLVVWRETGPYTMPADLSAPPTPSNTRQNGPSLNGEQLVYETDQRTGAATVRLADDDPTDSWRLPAGTDMLTIVDDELLVQGSGRLYFLARGGGVTHYAIGQFYAARGQWVLWRGCDEQLRCTLNVGTKDQAVVHSYPLDAELWGGGPWGVGLAPDGATVVVSRPNQVRPALVRLEDGLVLADVDVETQVDWTPDGAWAFVRLPGDRVVAVSTRDGRQIPIELPFRFDAQQVALAVG